MTISNCMKAMLLCLGLLLCFNVFSFNTSETSEDKVYRLSSSLDNPVVDMTANTWVVSNSNE